MRLRDLFLVLVTLGAALIPAAILAGLVTGEIGLQRALLATSISASLVTISVVLIDARSTPKVAPFDVIGGLVIALVFSACVGALAVALYWAADAIANWAAEAPSDTTKTFVSQFDADRVAWIALAIGLVALALAVPPVRTPQGADPRLTRIRRIVELLVSAFVAFVAIVLFDRIRTVAESGTVPDTVALAVGAIAGIVTLILLAARRSPKSALTSGDPPRGGTDAPADATPPAAAGPTQVSDPPCPPDEPDDQSLRVAVERTWGDRASWLFVTWAAGTVATVGLVPGLVGVATVAVLLVAPHVLPTGSGGDAAELLAVTVGPLVGVIAWLLTGLLAARYSTVDRANPAMYEQLRTRVSMLAPGAETTAEPAATKRARVDVCRNKRSIERSLGLRGDGHPPGAVQWVTGSGYVSLWQRLHLAEETELLYVPPIELLKAGSRDRARLEGSTIRDRDALLKRLDESLVKVRTAGTASEPAQAAEVPVAAHQGSPDATNQSDPIAEARIDLQDIRQRINEFKDGRSEQLIHVRRRLTQSLVWTGMIGYLLLILAIITGVDPQTIAVASGLYLVAALAGLLHRVYREFDMRSGQEDFGVTTARLILAPMLSGMAGLAGVVLIAILGEPYGIFQEGTGLDGNIADAFNLAEYPFALVAAAAFGLAPGALFTRLKAVTEQLKTDIASSGAADDSAPKPID